MKSLKIVAGILVLTMLAFACVSCKSTPQVTVNATVSVSAPDDPIVLNYGVSVSKPEGETITVLDLVRQALDEMEIKYELNENNDGVALSFDSITSTDGVTYTTGYTDASKEYYGMWLYTVDGVEPTGGKAGTIPANDGTVIVYTYTVESQAELAEAAD